MSFTNNLRYMRVSLPSHRNHTKSGSGQPVDTFINRILKNQACTDELHAINYHKLISDNPSLDFILCMLPAVTWMADVVQMRYRFISSNVKRILGYRPQQFMEGEIPSIEMLIHPGDVLLARSQKKQAWDFYLGLPVSQRKHYQYNRHFRIQKADGSYEQLLEQNSVLQTDSYGRITHLLGTYACLAHIINSEMPAGSEDYPDARELFGFSLPVKPCQSVLSKRELEIVKLIADGYSSKQIAQHLCISFHTVNTHRQKMIEKTHTKNTGGLIQFAANQGLI